MNIGRPHELPLRSPPPPRPPRTTKPRRTPNRRTFARPVSRAGAPDEDVPCAGRRKWATQRVSSRFGEAETIGSRSLNEGRRRRFGARSRPRPPLTFVVWTEPRARRTQDRGHCSIVGQTPEPRLRASRRGIRDDREWTLSLAAAAEAGAGEPRRTSRAKRFAGGADRCAQARTAGRLEPRRGLGPLRQLCSRH
ncbi:uncharacterized protein A4U43_C01F30350 [Asparagus officinalis]|uniref:Uncharacterized protein n=1 Tax=Asparagus officinalis TaxID=4686 RepID=A0A5P1FU90_ASPOF|nr:uncharacterized protein A4U43_C01F30350 [Asparagus officinalis]